MNRFLITGFPRSRTAWLANLMTFGGSFCFHDALRRCEAVHDLPGLMRRYALENVVRSVGVSDSGLPLFAEELPGLFAGARLVVVEREAVEALESFCRVFPSAPEDRVVRLFERAREGLARMRTTWRGPVLVVPFADLDRAETGERIWKFCHPFEPFNAERWRELHAMRVTMMPEKVSVCPEILNQIERSLAWEQS